MFKRHLLSLVLALFAVAGWAQTSTLTFTKACGGAGTADDGIKWTVTSDGTESTYVGTYGIHYGTNKAEVTYIKLSTSGFEGKNIKKVVVEASTAKGISSDLSVTVGGEAFGTSQSLTSANASGSSNQAYTFEGSLVAGEVIVELAKPSKAAKALYVKSVAVTYEDNSSTKETPTFEFAAETASANLFQSFTAPVLTNNSDGNLTFKSSDTEVATVDAATGEVTIVAAGTTTITATLEASDTYKSAEAEYVLTVVDPRVAPTFSFASESVDGSLGEDFTAPALTNNSDGTLSYESSYESVATVDATTGKVTIKGVGITAIKASVEATQSYFAAEASYIITVTDPNASDVTFDFSTNPTTGDLIGTPITIAPITLTFNDNDASNISAWNNDGHIRFYTDNSLVVEGNNVVITKIEFTVTRYGDITASTGTYEDYAWTGNTQSVTFTAGSQSRITSIKVEYSKPAPATITYTNPSKEGFGTFYSDKNVKLPEGLTATSVIVEEGKMQLPYEWKAGSVIPANTGVVIKAEGADKGATYTLTIDNDTEATAAHDFNMLLGSVEGGTTTGANNDLFYMLSYDKTGENIGFYYGAEDGAAFECGAGKAYLAVNISDAFNVRGFAFTDDVVTAINTVAKAQAQQGVFTLDGRRVNGKAKQGLYIVNGKKVVVK